jgi:hypothetical protein
MEKLLRETLQINLAFRLARKNSGIMPNRGGYGSDYG